MAGAAINSVIYKYYAPRNTVEVERAFQKLSRSCELHSTGKPKGQGS